MKLNKEQKKALQEIKKQEKQEAKRDAEWKKQLAKAASKRSPAQQAEHEYINKVNRLGYGTTKKEVSEARKNALSHMDKHKG